MKRPTEDQRVIFVFGSNLAGIHGAGSARVAHDRHGAKWGEGVGLHGNSYAIPTKDRNIHRTLTLDEIAPYAKEFCEFAKKNQHLFFQMVAVGCGRAGYAPAAMAPLFVDAYELPNVQLPFEFTFVLEREKEDGRRE